MKRIFILVLIGLFLSTCSTQAMPAATQTPELIKTSSSKPIPKAYGPIKINANPEKGYYWPYYLYVPAYINNSHFLVIPNNTGKNNDFSYIEKITYQHEVNDWRNLANKLGSPLIVPVFPRPDNDSDGTIASQYLGRGNLEESWCKKYPDLCRQDLQLLSMVDDARDFLRTRGVETKHDIFICGYSASGMFTNRFVILHPERVKAAAFGGHGWTTVPIEKWENIKLPFPYGIADLFLLTKKEFNLADFCKVKIFSYMGEFDNNGWALPWYVGNNNRTQIYRSIISKFGNTSTGMLSAAKMILESINCPSKFKIYPEANHGLTNEMDLDVINFFMEQTN